MMFQKLWSAVDDYFLDRLLPPDPILEAVLKASASAGLPPHQVSPPQGKLLHLLARMQQARSILELGTLGGYSTIWLARALPEDGRLITLEIEPRCAEVARANIARAGLDRLIELRLGTALDTLAQVEIAGDGPFDLIFIDADKARCPEYFDWALKLSRPGTVIVVDNVVRGGDVINEPPTDDSIRGIQRLLDNLRHETRVNATALQTVGSKGHDGFVIAIVATTTP